MASVKIYRGTKEIGGTAIELKSENNRILLDIGQPLIWDDKPFDKNQLNATGKGLVFLGTV